MTQHRTTAKKSRYLAVFEQKLLLKVVSVAKVKPKDSEGWWIQGLKRVFLKNAQRRRLRRKKNKLKNGKFSTWAPLATLKFYLRYCTRKSNCFFIFDFNLQILSSTSIFKFYLQLQSSNSIFNFNLQILSSTSIFALLAPDCHFKLMKLVEKIQH